MKDEKMNLLQQDESMKEKYTKSHQRKHYVLFEKTRLLSYLISIFKQDCENENLLMTIIYQYEDVIEQWNKTDPSILNNDTLYNNIDGMKELLFEFKQNKLDELLNIWNIVMNEIAKTKRINGYDETNYFNSIIN